MKTQSNLAVQRILLRNQARELSIDELNEISGGNAEEEGGCVTLTANSCTVRGDTDCGTDD